MTGPGVGLLVALLKAVARLALSSDEQVAYLNAIGVGGCADELALEIGDEVPLLPQFVEAGWLSEDEAIPVPPDYPVHVIVHRLALGV